MEQFHLKVSQFVFLSHSQIQSLFPWRKFFPTLTHDDVDLIIREILEEG